jgi:dTDP-4-amino-4,6-dideoxygalactose transaminase
MDFVLPRGESCIVMALFEQKVFFGNPVDQFNAHREEILAAIERVCTAGPHILGEVVEKFESEFAVWNGIGHAVGVGSGTDALVLAMKSFGIGPGDEVITVSHTALATVAAIVLAGATPVLVDVYAETSLMDPTKLAAALSPRTKAIIPVHLYGFSCPMDEILGFAASHNLVVIEDCAQAHGATYRGAKVGTMGHAGCFSFYPTKNLGAIGDGGAVITADAAIAEGVRQRRQYGWDSSRVAHVAGALSRLDTLQAAVLSIKLKYLDSDNERRRKIAEMYNRTIKWSGLSRPRALPNVQPVYHLYVITSERREEIRAAFSKENVELGLHYAHPAHRHPGYSGLVRIPVDGLPVTEMLSDTVLSLPIYPEFPLSAAEKIAEFLNAE